MLPDATSKSFSHEMTLDTTTEAATNKFTCRIVTADNCMVGGPLPASLEVNKADMELKMLRAEVQKLSKTSE